MYCYSSSREKVPKLPDLLAPGLQKKAYCLTLTAMHASYIMAATVKGSWRLSSSLWHGGSLPTIASFYKCVIYAPSLQHKALVIITVGARQEWAWLRDCQNYCELLSNGQSVKILWNFSPYSKYSWLYMGKILAVKTIFTTPSKWQKLVSFTLTKDSHYMECGLEHWLDIALR